MVGSNVHRDVVLKKPAIELPLVDPRQDDVEDDASSTIQRSFSRNRRQSSRRNQPAEVIVCLDALDSAAGNSAWTSIPSGNGVGGKGFGKLRRLGVRKRGAEPNIGIL
jgi:hypothetical protein